MTDPVITDPAVQATNTPGSITATSLLMQDAVAADILSIHGGDNQVAPFANPFAGGKEEALVVDTDGHLTHVRRAPEQATGWAQDEVKAGHDHPVPVQEVVVLVHPGDLSTWAIVTDQYGKPHGLKLVGETTPAGSATYKWVTVGPVPWQSEQKLETLGQMYVGYDGRSPSVVSIDTTTGNLVYMAPLYRVVDDSKTVPFLGFTTPVKISAQVHDIVGGVVTRFGIAFGPIFYVRTGQTVTRYDIPGGGKPEEMSAKASRLVGVYATLVENDLGCLFLETNGVLVAKNKAGGVPSGYAISWTPGLGFVTATSWADVNQMVHVYGIAADDSLKVLHQSSWSPLGLPVWTTARNQVGMTTPMCVGVVAGVAGFVLDPFPDYLPSELVTMRGAMSPADRFCFCTQDITTTRWTREKIHLPSSGNPHMVTHYATDVTVLDRRGAAMPDQPVTVSAETLVGIQVDGAAYLVGPGHAAQLAVGPLGKMSITTTADGLIPPTLHIDTPGLTNGAVVQSAAAVHDYLSGTGTLPSQQGRFDWKALQAAKADGQHIVKDPNNDKDIKAVATSVDQVFKKADGTQLVSRLFRGTGPAPAIHAFACGSLLPEAGDASGRPPGVVYHEFSTPEEVAEHLAAIRALPNYGGIWEDFVDWASDLWEGVKNGVIDVVHVVVEAVTTVIVKIGELVVELVGYVIDGIVSAVRTVEAVFRQIIAAIVKVVDWLKALFSFQDIWLTKKALQDGMKTLVGYAGSGIDHYGHLAHDWFLEKENEVTALFEGWKAQYGTVRMGDLQNQTPPAKDASGGSVDRGSLQSNPQGSWLMDRATRSAGGPAARTASIAVPEDTPIVDVFAKIAKAIEDSHAFDDVTTALGDLYTVLQAMVDPTDPNAGGTAMTAVLDFVEHLVLAVLKFLDALVKAVVDLIVSALGYVDDLWTWKLDLGPVNTLYKWIQTTGGVVEPGLEPEDLTIGGLVFLVMAFFVTTTHKLIHGVDQVPFPGGKFPAIGAPPWHPGPLGPEDVADADLRVYNKWMCGLQQGFSAAALLGALPDGYGDWKLALKKPGEKVDLFEVVAAGFSMVLSAGSGMALSFPPVTGNKWTDPGWMGSCVVMSCNFGLAAVFFGNAVYAYRNGKDASAFLKNAGDGKWGPVIATTIGLADLAFVITGLVMSHNDPTIQAMEVIGILPLILQVIRVKASDADESFLPRVAVVTAVDAASTLVASVMGLILPGTNTPGVQGQTPDDGWVGEAYDYGIGAYGGTDSWNRPLKDFANATDGITPIGALPKGLAIITDPDHPEAPGRIRGIPEAAGDAFTFGVECTDSYGPPRYADVMQLSLKIGPTKVGTLADAGPKTRAMPISGSGVTPPITVTVTDTAGAPLKSAGVRFTLTAGTTGACGTFATRAGGQPAQAATVDVATAADGTATAPVLTANSVAGDYTLTVNVPGVPSTGLAYTITNQPLPGTAVATVPGSTPQTATGSKGSYGAFPNQLNALVTVNGAPRPGMLVQFAAPAPDGNGRTWGHFANGTQATSAVSDANGVASAGIFTADNSGLSGTFQVTAVIPGTSAQAVFVLTLP